jgi:hypothetical protein
MVADVWDPVQLLPCVDIEEAGMIQYAVGAIKVWAVEIIVSINAVLRGVLSNGQSMRMRLGGSADPVRVSRSSATLSPSEDTGRTWSISPEPSFIVPLRRRNSTPRHAALQVLKALSSYMIFKRDEMISSHRDFH